MRLSRLVVIIILSSILLSILPIFVAKVESYISTNTLYAHAETTTIGPSAYRLLKTASADGPATSLSALATSTGRKLMGRWVYPLTGILSIPSSTWTVTYRAKTSSQASSVVAHGDVDILIRKSDNTIRTTIATNVANSPSLTLVNTWQTLTGTYSWTAYTVVAQTDYLEVAYYIEVTTAQSSKSVYLRIDDNTLGLADQTKIANVMFAYPATIWTDKADYEYYETVTMFGSGFEALANVTVTIVRPDGASDAVCAVTDVVGNFTCTYQLNGIPGTYTITATDGTNTATTTFREGAITPKLYGYTLEPSPGWTSGDVKGYYECEWVPYKIEITSTKKESYNLTVIVHHDYYDGTWYGLNQTRNFQMFRNGVPETPSISGPAEDGWESGIQQLQFNWTFTINEDDNCTLMFEPHIAIGAHNYPGSKVHTHIHDITSVPDTPISAGHRDVPIVVEGPPLCSVTFYTEPSTVGNISFQSGTYTNGQSDTFVYGTSGPATANAPSGWEFDHWEATGNVQVSNTTANPTTVTITCGGTLKAYFKQIECLVTFCTDPSTIGSINFESDIYFDGDTDTFTYGTSGLATANVPSGWVFDHWEVSGNVQVSSTTTNPTTVTITCGGTLKAVFEPIQCTVTFYTDPSTVGSITFEGQPYTNGQSDTFTYGTSGLATANAPACWEFDHWETTGNVGVSNTSANPTTVTITCGGTLKAVFNQIEYTLTITTTPGGTTNPAPGSYQHPCSSNVQVTAINDPCYEFDHWELDTVDVGSVNPYTVHMDANHTLHAVFTKINYTLTITTTAGGTTSPSPSSYVYPCSTNVTVTAIPNTCYVFDHWELDGSPAGSANPITVHMNQNHTLHAVFTKINYTLTITSTTGGTTNPSPGAHVYPCSTNVSVTATPDTCYQFDHWELDGFDVGSVNPYIVHMDANHTLHAVFIKINYTLTITTTAGGTTSPAPGSHEYPCSSNVPVTAIPGSGYVFNHWELDTVNVGSVNPYSVHMDSDHTLHAVFNKVPPVGGYATLIGSNPSSAPLIDFAQVLAAIIFAAAVVSASILTKHKTLRIQKKT